MLISVACGGSSGNTEKNNIVNTTKNTDNSTNKQDNKTTKTNDGKILIAYFSATGNTKLIAEHIARVTGGSDISTSSNNIKKICSSDVNCLKGQRFENDATADDVKEWVDSLDIR